MTQYDYIVIGVGSVGCVTANQMTQHPKLKVHGVKGLPRIKLSQKNQIYSNANA
ncbi:hypothetical protein [Nostoc sp. PA-18-2419]|uniref:hypothetical protein n=1 Tax=Nostoc sp. PA-18-2419 TaxID=2575443 RepID=UPI00167A2060|nr:hypothetical protein [Nostoc sp. PA-18-2419]